MKKTAVITVLLFICLMCIGAFAAEGDVYYLKDGGSGSGESYTDAGGSLAEAYNSLYDGGTVVVCGTYTVSESFAEISHSGKITVTSVYGGVDYRVSDGANIVFMNNMYLGGETEFCNITLNSGVFYPSIFANNHKTLIGDGVECGKVNGSEQYLSLMGGSRAAHSGKETDLTINSGKWQRVRGGTAAGGSEKYTVHLTVNGGEFVERVTLGSSAAHSGDIYATVNGGIFYQGMVGATMSAATDKLLSNVYLTINGGTFYSKLGLAANSTGIYIGSFNVSINGGEFAHLVEFEGTSHLVGGMTSVLDGSINFSEEEHGTYTLQNPIRQDGADPWLFYHDGYYYYTSTTDTAAVKLTRATNIGDLIRANGTEIYTPAANMPWSESTWSPTILHYTDEEIGEGNGGWYMYFGAEDETDIDDVGHRMYVLKCLDGDNLLGRWGNPITNEVNLPERVSAPDIAGFDDVWAAGQGDVRINGRVYVLYVTEAGRYTADFHQMINILPMTNPWTFEGTPTVICVPEYDWEMHGYKYNSATGIWAPKVVEAATPVYSSDGSVFVVYSGSNYTTDNYCLGQLKFLGGDPMVAANWEKKPTPILSQGNGVRGTGSASYVTDTAGQGWVCYNAYLDSDENRTRHAMIAPYTATGNGVVIGDGSGIAASEAATYQAALNPMPLSEKARYFTALSIYGVCEGGEAKLTFTPVESAVAYIVRRDGVMLGATETLDYTDSDMPIGAHTYRVEAVLGGKVISSDTVRLVNFEGVRFTDVNGDGEIDIADILLLTGEMLDGSENGVTLIDILRLLKCTV